MIHFKKRTTLFTFRLKASTLFQHPYFRNAFIIKTLTFQSLFFLPHFRLIPSAVSKLFINFAKCKPKMNHNNNLKRIITTT